MKLTFWEAVAVLTGTTIGAGVLAIPYAVAQVGWIVGVAYLLILGFLLLGLNLMLGEIVMRTREPLQIPGLAGKYLGRYGRVFASVIYLFSAYGVLLAYIVGEGEVLSALFGGSSFAWSLVFTAGGVTLVYYGLRLVKKADLFLILIILAAVLMITFLGTPHFSLENLYGFQPRNLFLPYGVILFALLGAGAIPQVEDILPEQRRLRRAIVTGSLIPLAVYFLFMTAVVGVTGVATTEVATIGLGRSAGTLLVFFGNLFAVFTMGTAFLNGSMAIKRQFEWDFKLSRGAAWLLTGGPPLLLFLIGARNFIAIVEFVGAVFGTITTVIIILIYWAAKQRGDVAVKRYALHHALLLSILLFVVFVFAALYSLWQNYGKI